MKDRRYSLDSRPSPSAAARRPPAEAVASRGTESAALPDIVCLSHLRWNFVFQRPQHILSRFAARQRVFFVEEPVADEDGQTRLVVRREGAVTVVVPHLSHEQLADSRVACIAQRALIDALLQIEEVSHYLLWFYTPMALPFTAHLTPRAVVYDCMDELSGFAGAPPEMRLREAELMASADLVLTGGRSLYEAKRGRHPNLHCFPSSVDAEHFRRARAALPEPHDQAPIPGPRIGYAGVIDERLDLGLIAEVAARRPKWHLVLLGPFAKIDPATAPRAPNIHYLGMKPYSDLPDYLAGWDVAMLPFAHNDATRYISPTKTPEYLAAGRPVVSTSIRDVARPYGDLGLAYIADDAAEVVDAIERALVTDLDDYRSRADVFLNEGSWDRTVAEMMALVDLALERGDEAQPELAAATAAAQGSASI